MTTLAGGGSPSGSASGRADGIGSVATFWWPFGIAVDTLGLVFVTDANNNLVKKISLICKLCALVSLIFLLILTATTAIPPHFRINRVA